MKPILLIHGYSAESDRSTKSAINGIYGDLPQALSAQYSDHNVVEINLSRYISLEDGISMDDVAYAFDRALRSDHPHLLESGFHAIVHSTGALVIRNWLRRFSKRPSPLDNLIYLAGANFGSGWAHIGQGQFAKWGRMVFGQGERGIRILEALEFGSNWTIELHRYFLDPQNSLLECYKVLEHVLIGSQADAAWFSAPIRYAKEDGSDGVVRVASSNLNFNYVSFGPTDDAVNIAWKEASSQQDRDLARRSRGRAGWYEIKAASQPGKNSQPLVPLAIPFKCAHTGNDMGIVTGTSCRNEVLELIDHALTSTHENWSERVTMFDEATANTYEQAKALKRPRGIARLLVEDPQAQYDKHAQIILRLRDQDGRPVEHYDIYFNSLQGRGRDAEPIGKLIETQHINGLNRNIITFYLRTDSFDAGANEGNGAWLPRVRDIGGCFLEVSATEPQTGDILYLPFRYDFDEQQLMEFVQPHRTTILDIDLLRLPSPDVYLAVKL